MIELIWYLFVMICLLRVWIIVHNYLFAGEEVRKEMNNYFKSLFK